ncbi:hypothetical protein EI77_03605 [Prosthecobacter fusiformis]|uniref:Uncharacterized protein n=1 Tax=Prosthecobacter fusiformis TaxID=48464 RepID=A0A4R7RM89_9BACT|nr:hypothetical protein [Prosthecobacter fusiformis]TDU66510.1 hypothetical protein EI77_03605 [Prosthecobacter fusiformis]
MNEFENIQRLLRLKQYETPGDDFVEDFLAQFRERQRSEIMRLSARDLLWERVNTFFSDLVSPKWATAGATAAFAVVAAWGTLNIVGNTTSNGSNFNLASADSVPSILQKKPAFALDLESDLIKKAMPQDEVLEISGILLSQHFEDDGLAAMTTTSGLTPVSAELLPISDFSR